MLHKRYIRPGGHCGAGQDRPSPRAARPPRMSYRNQRKARVAAIVKIVEFFKENIGFQWSWWVPERPESGPRGHRNTPRAASEDQMDSWEVPGERPEAVWRRFGSSRGAFEALSESVFRSKKLSLATFNRREDAKCFQLEQTHEALRFRPNLRRRPLTTQWIARVPFAVA